VFNEADFLNNKTNQNPQIHTFFTKSILEKQNDIKLALSPGNSTDILKDCAYTNNAMGNKSTDVIGNTFTSFKLRPRQQAMSKSKGITDSDTHLLHNPIELFSAASESDASYYDSTNLISPKYPKDSLKIDNKKWLDFEPKNNNCITNDHMDYQQFNFNSRIVQRSYDKPDNSNNLPIDHSNPYRNEFLFQSDHQTQPIFEKRTSTNSLTFQQIESDHCKLLSNLEMENYDNSDIDHSNPYPNEFLLQSDHQTHPVFEKKTSTNSLTFQKIESDHSKLFSNLEMENYDNSDVRYVFKCHRLY
jgi:hypothetical protein